MLKGARDGYDTLIDIFECLEYFHMRLMTHAQLGIELTSAMTEIHGRISVRPRSCDKTDERRKAQ